MVEWVNIATLSVSELTFVQIETIIDGLSAELHAGRFAELDSELSKLDPKIMCVDAIVAVSRSIYCVRDKLPQWSEFVDRSYFELKGRGEISALVGLFHLTN